MGSYGDYTVGEHPLYKRIATVSMLVTAALLASTPPSAAQEAVPGNPAYQEMGGDVPALKDCVENEGRNAGSCIGRVSGYCTAEPSQDEPLETLKFCWAREQLAWDHLLNAEYAERVAEAKEQDAAPDNESERESFASLRDAQRAWIGFRDAELRRFWMKRAPYSAKWRDADSEKLKAQLTATRYIDLHQTD